MSLQHIEVAIDPELVSKGDVIIIKRSFFNPNAPLKLETRCTHCGGNFPTELRRMQRKLSGGKRQCEVRNVPQCAPCRSRYHNAQQRNDAAPLLPETAPKSLPAPKFSVGQVVRLSERSRYIGYMSAPIGALARVTKSASEDEKFVDVEWLDATHSQFSGAYLQERFEVVS